MVILFETGKFYERLIYEKIDFLFHHSFVSTTLSFEGLVMY